jgi:tetratricopeptide (TPR) repeat protein
MAQTSENFQSDAFPIDPRAALLPFMALHWEGFERFCVEFVKCMYPEGEEVYRNGTQGDAQEGIDIVLELNANRCKTFQCKRVEGFQPHKVRAAIKDVEKIDKKTYQADEYIILVGSTVHSSARKEIKKYNNWSLWDAEDISSKIRELPAPIARKLVETCFSPIWRDAFLGDQPQVPGRVFMVPRPQDRLFVGREEVLQKLRDTLQSKQRVALTGFPGIGKTQTVVEYAYRYEKEYQHIFWVGAQTESELTAGFTYIAQSLHLVDPKVESKEALAFVRLWLQENENWLLVLDNADELQMVQRYLPSLHRGHIVLTMRSSVTGRIAPGIGLESMSEEEGTLLLLRRAKLINHNAELENASLQDGELAKEIVRELEGLPLALDQSGAYIEETPSSLSEYLQCYRQAGIRLLDRPSEFNDGHLSITTTFNLAFNQVQMKNQAAGELLLACAFLAPDAIPEEIFTNSDHWHEPLKGACEDLIVFRETFKEAYRYCLLQRDTTEETLSIHRLVQKILKDGLDKRTGRLWAERLVYAVNKVFPYVKFEKWHKCERLMPSALAVTKLIEEYEFDFEEAFDLLDKAGYYLRERGRYIQAQPFYELTLAIVEKTQGPEHPEVGNRLHYLALILKDQGKNDEAEIHFKRALGIYEADLEKKGTGLNSLNSLARLYKDQKRYLEAEKLLWRSLKIRENIFVAEPLKVALALNELADLYKDMRPYRKAARLYEKSLEIQRKSLEPNNIGIARTLESFAWLRIKQRLYDKSEALFNEALELKRAVSSEDHVEMASLLTGLASLCVRQDRYEEAESYYISAISLREKAYGPDHLKIADILDSHAQLLQRIGRTEEAAKLRARSKAIKDRFKKIHFPEDPQGT